MVFPQVMLYKNAETFQYSPLDRQTKTKMVLDFLDVHCSVINGQVNAAMPCYVIYIEHQQKNIKHTFYICMHTIYPPLNLYMAPTCCSRAHTMALRSHTLPFTNCFNRKHTDMVTLIQSYINLAECYILNVGPWQIECKENKSPGNCYNFNERKMSLNYFKFCWILLAASNSREFKRYNVSTDKLKQR